jgi:hypothetical protein
MKFIVLLIVITQLVAAQTSPSNLQDALIVSKLCTKPECLELENICNAAIPNVEKCMCSTAFYMQYSKCLPACVGKNNKAVGTEWDLVMTTDQLTDACTAAGIVFAVPTQNNPTVSPPISQNTTNSNNSSFDQAVQEAVVAIETVCLQPECQALVPICNATSNDISTCACFTPFYMQYSKCWPACVARAAPISGTSNWSKVMSPTAFAKACAGAGHVFPVPANLPDAGDSVKNDVKNGATRLGVLLFVLALLL